MRIGLAIETDSPGGAESMLLELAAQLLARGHEVVAFGPTGGAGWLTARFAAMGIERDLIDFRGPFGLGGVSDFAGIVRTRRLSVLHSHDFGMSVFGSVAARAAGCRHVITMHGGTYYGSHPRRRVALRLAGAMSAHTVAVSEAFRTSLAASLWMRSDSIQVVHNGVADARGCSGRLRKELGLAPGDVLLLAVGNLLAVKGHSILLEALATLSRSHPRIVLAIAGTGPEEARLTSWAAEFGVEEAVRLLGYRSDIRDLLEDADVFVMPSLSEGLPMAMIEAMIAGRAIVASDAGGIRELLSSPDLGTLVRPGDVGALARALADLIRDPDRRRRMGDAARSRALDAFTASAMAERYLSLYAL